MGEESTGQYLIAVHGHLSQQPRTSYSSKGIKCLFFFVPFFEHGNWGGEYQQVSSQKHEIHIKENTRPYPRILRLYSDISKNKPITLY